MEIIAITKNSPYLSNLLDLEIKLWPNNTYQTLLEEFDSNYYFGAFTQNRLIGFIQLSLRHEYVNGSSSSPVGYIEGIFVEREYRHQGLGTKLMQFSFDFFKQLSCQEVISDVEIDNKESQIFHKKIGFQEKATVIYYSYRLKE